MAYLSASKLTFTPKWMDMSDEQQTAEQVAAYEIVAKYGGEIKAQYWLVTDGCLFGVTEYPDESSAFKSSLAIQGRGAFELQIQRATPLDELIAIAQEVAGN